MRRLHPISAVVSVARSAIQGAFLGFFVGTAAAGTSFLPPALAPFLSPLGAVVFGGYATARYLRFRYEIAGDTLAVESGVFARQSREIPLGRIQNVDLRQGILNRLFGLSIVEFETAGGSATEATLDAVADDEAERLRELVQAHDRTADSGSRQRPSGDRERAAADRDGVVGPMPAESADRTPDAAAVDPALDADERADDRTSEPEQLFAFTLRELLTYAVVSVRPAAPVLTLAGLPLGGDIVRAVLRYNTRLIGTDASVGLGLFTEIAPPRFLLLAALTLVEFLLLALVVSVALTVVEYYGFRLTRQNGDLLYERGLLRRYSGNIPLSKVQTVSVHENALMRQFGLATLVVETAGYAGGNQESSQGVAVPMADRETVYELARDIEPFGEVAFEQSPPRARRRYAARFAIAVGVVTGAVYAVDRFLLDTGLWWLPLLALLAVPLAAHLRWKHRGFDLTDDALVTRSGFWRRSTRVVPYYRIQTVFVTRSIFQRRRDLATVVADTASTASLFGGDARVYDVDDGVAADLRDELRQRLRVDLLERKRSGDVGEDRISRFEE